MNDLYLGLDSSTQSLSALVIDFASGVIVAQHILNYDQAFSHYRTHNGVLHDSNPAIVHAPPLMWLEALDRMLIELGQQGVPMHRIAAISGSAQQHATVYLKQNFSAALRALKPDKPLHQQLHACFSRATAPVWMDHSTSNECQSLAHALGGQDKVYELTGSIATERFSAAQIKKFARQQPEQYAQTAHISLLSSLMSSVCSGQFCGVDYTDASGTNLLNIKNKTWDPKALAACADELENRLGSPVAPDSCLGGVNPFFVKRYGFSASCQVLAWCGDNPSSAIGLGLIEANMTAISLGTSDTCFGILPDLPEQIHRYANRFITPNNEYMLLMCFKNGSLARETLRKQFHMDWSKFSAALTHTKPGNQGALCLPWVSDEITPRVSQPGIRSRALDQHDSAAVCRGLIEGQMMAICNHAMQSGLNPQFIKATGGASQNREILTIMANVFNCPVAIIANSNSAALGAALRAAHAVKRTPWPQTVAAFTQTLPGTQIDPDSKASAIYKELKLSYAEFERKTLNEMQ